MTFPNEIVQYIAENYRFSKGYRHPTLDTRLNKARTKQEVRGMWKAREVRTDRDFLQKKRLKIVKILEFSSKKKL